MLLSRLKVKDGRVERRGEINYGKKVFEKRGWIIEHTPEGTFVIKKPSGNYYGSPSSLEEGKKYIENELKSSSQDSSITEGSKIVVNTENHVNENALAIKVNEDNCLVRFENGDEETIPIESISAFESMANDAEKIPEGYINYYGAVVKNTPEDILRQVQKTLYPNENKDKCMKDAPAPKDFFDLDEWKAKAKELGYTIENNKTRGLWIAKEGIGEMGTYNPTKGGRLIVSRPYLDQSSYETETKINELKQNMDAARARGYDTAPYQKEIDRLKSMDANNVEIKKNENGYYDVLLNGKAVLHGTTEQAAKKAAIQFGLIDASEEIKDKYTGDPLTDKGKEIMASLKERYGEEKGEQVFYAMKNSGQIEGIDATDGGPGSGVKGHTTAENNNTPQPSGGRTSYKENPKGRIAQKRNELIRKRTEQIKKSGGVLPHEIDYIIKPALAAIKKGIDPHKAFANAAENENYHGDREDIKADRKRIINYLSKKHGIHLNSEKIDKMV